ncbi:uncharacterized protein LOC100575929 [Acyrthosiphon pisum]|nr:uncharacterized protein LOC100575929 [Acyrthosiphon pisum]|eukprot:XP_003241793.2 PREDICTED: uncharacterized protein LOC100575929 [Acyrthosiphon pisum]
MPNYYKRTPGSRTYHNFSEETLENALNEIRNNRLTYRQASDKYGIPISTLSRKKNKLNLNPHGGQTALTSTEEDNIVETILFASDWGYPFDREEVKRLIKSYLDRAGRKIKIFKNNKPGDDWYTRFVSRHSGLLKPRLSENIKRSRAAVSRTTINEYFNNLELSLENVPPQNIINYDETNFIDDPGRTKVLVRKKNKHAD